MVDAMLDDLLVNSGKLLLAVVLAVGWLAVKEWREESRREAAEKGPCETAARVVVVRVVGAEGGCRGR